MQPQQQYPYPPQQAYPQQVGPPPGYAQAYPQQAVQPQYAPPPVPQQAPTYGGVVPQFHAPAPPQASIVRPRMQDFAREGRLVLIKPTKLERDVPNTKGKPGDKQDRLTADVVILDGAPFPYGGQPENGNPHTHQASIPHEIPSMFISSAGLISQVERKMNEFVLGRLSMRSLPNGNTAYRLDDASSADEQVCQAYLVAAAQGRISPPQAVPQSAPPAQAAYAPQSAPPAPMYQQPPQQAYAPAQAPAQAQYAPAPQQAYAPPAAQLDITNPPPGVDPGWWGAQTPEVRQMVAAQSASRPGV